MTSCCSNGRCIHCRRDLRWFVAGLAALALVSVSDNDSDRQAVRSGALSTSINAHLAQVSAWIAGDPRGSQSALR